MLRAHSPMRPTISKENNVDSMHPRFRLSTAKPFGTRCRYARQGVHHRGATPARSVSLWGFATLVAAATTAYAQESPPFAPRPSMPASRTAWRVALETTPAFTWVVTPVTQVGASTASIQVQDQSAVTGNGGAVGAVSLTVSTPQSGAQAGAILAQSAGGNAGSVNAGNSWNGPIDGPRPQWTVSSGNGGAAGNVDVTVSSKVVASGMPMAIDASGVPYSVGVAAQSLGGSGGNIVVGGHDAIDFVGTVGHGGAAGNVQVTMSGSVAVGNAQATTGTTVGILAQSLGGGAGVADVYAWKQGNDETTVAAGGTAGSVVVTVALRHHRAGGRGHATRHRRAPVGGGGDHHSLASR